MTKLKSFLSYLAVILFSCFLTIIFVNAWTEPSSPPPQDNVDAPLNIGSEGQAKKGALMINTEQSFQEGLRVYRWLTIRDTNNPGSELNLETQPGFHRIAFHNLRFWDWEWGGDMVTFNNGRMDVVGSIYTPIIYDLNNSNYYVDPAGDSKFNAIILGGVRRTSWPTVTPHVTFHWTSSEGTIPLGQHDFCALSATDRETICRVRRSNGYWYLTQADCCWCYAVCLDF